MSSCGLKTVTFPGLSTFHPAFSLEDLGKIFGEENDRETNSVRDDDARAPPYWCVSRRKMDENG